MPLRIFNTLSGRVEDFEPIGSPVRLYCCGMTPKYHPHIGHARLFVDVDFMRRTLEHFGYQVRHIQNFTDIDDKTISRAEEEGVTAAEIARKYTDSYFATMEQLAVKKADEYPTVTGYMGQIVDFVEALVDRGFGYVVDGDVWFSVERFPGYGKLSGRVEESGMVGVRKNPEPGKRDPRDFALWKAAKPGDPSWPSPWGQGRPGWHIECSTMVRETLGDQIDIHCGAEDLIFPHHENEIAQSEALTGLEPFARYWPHVGWVTADSGEKMSHSLWNFVTLQDVLEHFDPVAVRLFLLQTHYRSPLAFSEEGLKAASRSLPTLRAAYGLGQDVPVDALIISEDGLRLKERFDQQLADDFNSPGAIGVLFQTAHEVNSADGAATDELRALFRGMTSVLGLPLDVAREAGSPEVAPLIDLLISVRNDLRAEKQWALADRVRDGLKSLGIVLKDSSEGTTWEREDS